MKVISSKICHELNHTKTVFNKKHKYSYIAVTDYVRLN